MSEERDFIDPEEKYVYNMPFTKAFGENTSPGFKEPRIIAGENEKEKGMNGIHVEDLNAAFLPEITPQQKYFTLKSLGFEKVSKRLWNHPVLQGVDQKSFIYFDIDTDDLLNIIPVIFNRGIDYGREAAETAVCKALGLKDSSGKVVNMYARPPHRA